MTDDDILTGIIRREGGATYTNRPSDRGRPTKYGVTQATLSAWRGRPCTPADVEALAEPEARAILQAEFIGQPGFDRIADPALREQLIDFGVNSSPARAIRWLQRAVGLQPVSGKVDAALLAFLDGAPARLVNNALVAARLYMIEAITDADVKQTANEAGWEHRALSFFVQDPDLVTT